MAYQEKNIGEGVFAADENNDRNSARGTFVRSGGAVTVGASTSGVVLIIDATEIRVGGNDYSAASGSVTLSDNSTAYPRRDLVFAVKGPTTSDPASYDFVTGQTIDDATMQTLVNEGVIDSNGQPIHEPEDIPEIQPPAFQGERTNAALLAMVYVPPGTADSTDLSGSMITDMRMEGIGVGDVLRSGDAVAEIEGYNQELDAHAENATRFDGRTHSQHALTNETVERSMIIDPNSTRSISFQVPGDYNVALWALGIVVGEGGSGTGDITFQRRQSDGTWENLHPPTTNALERPATLTPDPDPLRSAGSSGQLFRYRVRNTDSTGRETTAMYCHTYQLAGGYGYVDE